VYNITVYNKNAKETELYMMVDAKIFPADAAKAKLLGEIGARTDRFLFERALSPESWKTACREAMDAFVNKWDDSSGLIGYWQGEFWGKWILSAVDACEYTGDEKLRDFIRESTYEIMSYQEPSGYVGTYRNPNFVVPGNAEVIQKVLKWGVRSHFNWNIWSRKYTLWGLIEAARLLNDPKILEAAVKLADQTLDTFDYVQLKVWDTGTFSGLPSCSIMKPMLLLYRLTGTQRYLDFAVEIADFWEDKDPRVMPRLIANARSGVPVSYWYNLTKDPFWTKSYEMMSCFEGLIELYSVTGTARYLESTECFWELLEKFEMNVFHGMGINDHLTRGGAYPNGLTEPCDNIHYMRLCHELFRYTGKVKYINAFESNFLNAFLAGVFEDGKWGARGVRSSRRHFIAHGQCEMKYNHCCVNNMPRAFVTAARTAVMTDEKNVYINFYTPCEVEVEIGGEKAVIGVSGSYLTDGKVTLNIRRENGWQGGFLLRLPQWAVGTTAVINGREVEISGSSYYELDLAPEQKICQINFAPVPVIRNTGEFELPADNDTFHHYKWRAGELTGEDMISTPHSYLHFGPLTLARSIRLGTAAEELFTNQGIEVKSCALKPVELPGTIAAFEAVIETPQGGYITRFCDYASAGNWESDEKDIFNVYF